MTNQRLRRRDYEHEVNDVLVGDQEDVVRTKLFCWRADDDRWIACWQSTGDMSCGLRDERTHQRDRAICFGVQVWEAMYILSDARMSPRTLRAQSQDDLCFDDGTGGANCQTMWCSMAAQENRVDGTVGAGFKPAYITAAPQDSPNSPICVVMQLAQWIPR